MRLATLKLDAGETAQGTLSDAWIPQLGSDGRGGQFSGFLVSRSACGLHQKRGVAAHEEDQKPSVSFSAFSPIRGGHVPAQDGGHLVV